MLRANVIVIILILPLHLLTWQLYSLFLICLYIEYLPLLEKQLC